MRAGQPGSAHQDFYPRSPCGERRTNTPPGCRLSNFYPRSPCGERLVPVIIIPSSHNISIHALLAESDFFAFKRGKLLSGISIHALLAESDFVRNRLDCAKLGFLSTLSLRRATAVQPRQGPADQISIHALLAESDCARCIWRMCGNISIHALLAESDGPSGLQLNQNLISIHALLAESDPRPSPSCHPVWDFYPRSPCGERPTGADQVIKQIGISIHALLAESDGQRKSLPGGLENFYPRSPCGERRWQLRWPHCG